MARLKHIAIRTPDVTGTVAFYKEAFGLEEVGKGRSGIYLSDGYINLAILNLKTPTSPAGRGPLRVRGGRPGEHGGPCCRYGRQEAHGHCARHPDG